jgi:hypothetical protein
MLKICFVIMPFSKTSDEHTEEYWTNHFGTFLKPLIETNRDLEARRSQALHGDILRGIIADLVVSRIAVADLTDHNPNVFWELGVRQSFKHGTVTIAEVNTKLPFDVSGKGTLFYYPKDHLKMGEFRKSFGEAIQDCLKNPDNPDSHVLETLSGRGTLFEIFRRDEALRRLEALLSECNYNLDGMEMVLGFAQKNLKNPQNRYVTSARFRSSAIELLTVNRYIDEDKSFFLLAEGYFGNILALYELLNGWRQDPERTENTLVERMESFRNKCKEFKKQVETVRDKLRERF